MPPDIVRPVATTTVGCLISMAYRMGMVWVDLKLDEGIMRAIGKGKSLSTSIVRGLGLVVEYSALVRNGLYDFVPAISSIEADKVRCMRGTCLLRKLTRRRWRAGFSLVERCGQKNGGGYLIMDSTSL